jgi:hypothetical protein
MAATDLNPRDPRDAQVLIAQGVLAEDLGVDLDQADRALRDYAASTATPLHDVAWRVVHLRLVIDAGLPECAR